jgi:hypothetical protein
MKIEAVAEGGEGERVNECLNERERAGCFGVLFKIFNLSFVRACIDRLFNMTKTREARGEGC